MSPTEKLRTVAHCLITSTPWSEEELKGMDDFQVRLQMLTDALIATRNGALEEASRLCMEINDWPMPSQSEDYAQAIRSLIVPKGDV